MARVLDGMGDSLFGDFIENDALGFCRVKRQGLSQMPRDGLSFTVFIGGKPDGVARLHPFFQIADNVLFVLADFIIGHELICYINAH